MSKVTNFVGSRWFFYAALFFGAILRVAHVFALRQTAWFENLDIDPQTYDLWAQQIAAGNWIGNTIFYQDPLYPYFLGTVYAIFGHNLLLVRLLQAGFGVGICCLTAVLGKRMFGPVVGNIAGLVAALYAPSIYYESQVEKTFLSVFLIAIVLFFAMKKAVGARLATGILLGIACLVRGNFLLLALFGCIWFLFERHETDKAIRKSSWQGILRIEKKAALHTSAFIVGLMFVLGLVSFRNYHVGGQWVLTTSQAGQNFYIGNNPANNTGQYVSPHFVRPNPLFEQEDFLNEAQVRAQKKMGPSEASSFWFKQGVRHIVDQPGWAISNFCKKFSLFWKDYEVPDNQDFYFLARDSWVLRLPLPTFGWLVPFALLGVIVGFRSQRDVRMFVGYVAVYCVSVVAFFILARYRMPILPPLFILAAFGVHWLWIKFKESDWKKVSYSLVLLALVFLGVFLGGTPHKQGFPQSYTNLGALYVRQGKYEKAIQAYQDALFLNPNSANTLRDMGVLLTRMDRLKEAEASLRRCVTVNPRHHDAWLFLGKLYDQTNRFNEAKQAYGYALQNQPGSAEAAFRLATVEQRTGQYEAAIAIYEKMLKLLPNDARIHHNLAVAYLSAGKIQLARKASDLSKKLGLALPADFMEKLNAAELKESK